MCVKSGQGEGGPAAEGAPVVPSASHKSWKVTVELAGEFGKPTDKIYSAAHRPHLYEAESFWNGWAGTSEATH